MKPISKTDRVMLAQHTAGARAASTQLARLDGLTAAVIASFAEVIASFAEVIASFAPVVASFAPVGDRPNFCVSDDGG
jgi:hypothetical protein